MALGKVVLVGAGPGDPELITVKGLKALASADVVVYDRLVSPELLAAAKPGAELIYVGKEPGRAEMPQEKINELLVSKALEGKLVVRLKGGDPYIFGRGEEECAYVISRGVPCEVVPGVPSFVGASAYAGIPLAGRSFSSAFAVVTGRVAEGGDQRAHVRRVAEVSRLVDMLVILMGVREGPEILGEVLRVRGDEPSAVVEWATTPRQRTVTGTVSSVAELLASGAVKNPAVIFVGRGVLLRGSLWRADNA